MSLLILPDDVIHEIIFYVSSRELYDYSSNIISTESLRPHGSFTPNSCRVHGFKDLMAISSTCVRLRVICGPTILRFVSLVRRSEIDAILAYPTRMDKWSDSKALQRHFIKEILTTNFSICAREELARLSFRPSVNGDLRFWSRYQRQFSANHYVKELEITNSSLKNGDLALFPQLTSLKVLDKPAETKPEGELPSLNLNLSILSINLETLLGCESLLRILPQLHELNLICDINSLEPHVSLLAFKIALGSSNNLSSFTLFVTDPDLLQYSEFVDTLHHIISTGYVQTIALRLTRKAGQRASIKKWDVFSKQEDTGPSFVRALNSGSSLRSVVVDFDLINRLLFPPRFLARRHDFSIKESICFYLIDYSLSVPKLLFKPREMVANIIQSIGATEVVFIYGEVIDQSHLHAIGVMSNLLIYLVSDAHRAAPYSAITQVSMEKAWSMSDDSLVRHFYESLIDSYDAAEKFSDTKRELAAKIRAVSTGDHHVFSSPRYRKREDYVVLLESSQGNPTPMMIPRSRQKPKDSFWPTEAMLKDLEHYCMREKPLSSIWD
ncbi:CIC11C00000004299 [Sungouiella intermedia]|uniref:CIC11C00000004299 n=1 Tax=Sungouiella intermedia TaxID=45354 RepID=A0A1L0E262_9ASCO|nr:CIC11C00000004299 [[Candida] intermedia]